MKMNSLRITGPVAPGYYEWLDGTTELVLSTGHTVVRTREEMLAEQAERRQREIRWLEAREKSDARTRRSHTQIIGVIWGQPTSY